MRESHLGRRRRLAATVLIALGIAVAGCGSTSSPSASSTGSIGHGANAKGPILIGALYSQGGVTAPVGIPDEQGLVATVKAINASGGIDGRQIELIKQNPESSVSQAVEDTKSLVKQHVVAMFGPESTTELAPLIPLVTAAHLPTLTNEGGIPLTAASGYMFEPENPVASGPAGAVVDEVISYMKAHHITRIAYISGSDANGQATDKFAFPLFAKSGLKIVNRQSVDPSASDYTQQFQQAKSAGAQTIFFSESGAAAAIAAKDFQALTFPYAKLFLLALSQPQISGLGSAASKVLVAQQPADVATQMPSSYQGYAVLQKWVSFARAHGLNPSDHFAAQGWDFMNFLAASIHKVGADPAALYKLWTSGAFTYDSMAGPITMTADNHGGITQPYDVMTQPNAAKQAFQLVTR